jgi:ribose transport system ATP-binding protein
MNNSQQTYALEARDMWKAFDGTIALKGARLALKAGSIHAFLGENGAGKSTLIKAITGVHRPDTGQLLMAGEEQHFQRPQDAIAAGVSAVYQERNVVPEFSVAENLFLHSPRRRAGFLDYKQMYADARPWLDRVGLRVDPRTKASELSVAQGQLLEIARALALETKLLLLDEPTASTTDLEASVLFDILRDLRSRGTAILFVSHKLEEVFALCDTMTVLRDGETILDGVATPDLTQADVITAMVGRSVTLTNRRTTVERINEEASPGLELRNVSSSFGHENINLSVESGTITGLYGLVGSGRTELAKTVMGIGRLENGEIRVGGMPARIRGPHDAIHRYRVGYVSEDRKGEGLILSHTIAKNVGITVWDKIKGVVGYVTDDRERNRVEPVVKRLAVKYSSLDQATGHLSGGNQQKVSVAKWLASQMDVLIVDEPTVGVDVRTKEDMYLLMEELSANGLAILMISSDLAEIVRMSDRIVVMAKMRIVDERANEGDYSSLSESIMASIMAA